MSSDNIAFYSIFLTFCYKIICNICICLVARFKNNKFSVFPCNLEMGLLKKRNSSPSLSIFKIVPPPEVWHSFLKLHVFIFEVGTYLLRLITNCMLLQRRGWRWTHLRCSKSCTIRGGVNMTPPRLGRLLLLLIGLYESGWSILLIKVGRWGWHHRAEWIPCLMIGSGKKTYFAGL